MNSFFDSDEFAAHCRSGEPLANCQSPDHRMDLSTALVVDMAQILCGVAAEVGFLVSKGRGSALVMGVAGSRRRPSLTLELTRQHHHSAYLLFSDPLLGITDEDGQPACLSSDRATSREQLHIHQLEGSVADLVEMRRLLANKLCK